MAKGAYVGVQGITPDLRPSIQSAIENERANRQEKFQKEQYEYQKQQNEIAKQQRERELDIKERELEYTMGVRDAAKRNQAFFKDYEKHLANAQSDIFNLAGSECMLLINPMIESIASDREEAELGDMTTAGRAKLNAGKTKQTVMSIASICKDYSQILGDEKSRTSMFDNFLDFKGTAPKGYKSVPEYLKAITSQDWKYIQKNGGQYLSNGALDIGTDKDGNVAIKIGDQTFSSIEAVVQHMKSYAVQKDSTYIDMFSNLNKDVQPIYEDIDTEFEKGRRYDFTLMERNFYNHLTTTPLNNYSDNYTYQQAVNDDNKALANMFWQYGFQDDDSNLKTVKDLKKAMWNQYRSKYHNTVTEKPKKTQTTVDVSAYDITDEESRKKLVQRLKSTGHQIDKSTAAQYERVFPIGNSVNKLIVEGDLNALKAYGFDAYRLANGNIELQSSTTTQNNKESGTTNSTRITEMFEINPSDAGDIQKLVINLIDKDNRKNGGHAADNIKWSDVSGLFNFSGFDTQTYNSNNQKPSEIDNIINKFDTEKYKAGRRDMYGDTKIPVVSKIKNAIKDYLPDDTELEVNEPGWGNKIEIIISDMNTGEVIKEYALNPNIDHNTEDEDDKKKQVHTVLRQIKEDFANKNYGGNIWRERTTSRISSNTNYGGDGGNLIGIWNSNASQDENPVTTQPSNTTTVNTGIVTNADLD